MIDNSAPIIKKHYLFFYESQQNIEIYRNNRRLIRGSLSFPQKSPLLYSDAKVISNLRYKLIIGFFIFYIQYIY